MVQVKLELRRRKMREWFSLDGLQMLESEYGPNLGVDGGKLKVIFCRLEKLNC